MRVKEMLAGAQVSPSIRFSPGELVAFDDTATKFYVRLEVDDRPGVLAQIAGAFGAADVSIKSVWQEGEGSEALLLIVTHRTSERQQRAAVAAVADLPPVREVAAVIRVESEEA